METPRTLLDVLRAVAEGEEIELREALLAIEAGLVWIDSDDPASIALTKAGSRRLAEVEAELVGVVATFISLMESQTKTGWFVQAVMSGDPDVAYFWPEQGEQPSTRQEAIAAFWRLMVDPASVGHVLTLVSPEDEVFEADEVPRG